MRKPRNIIAPIEPPPVAGFVWECQCARCGATALHHRCHDPDHVRDDIIGTDGSCLVCDGYGGWFQCCEEPQLCLDNPMHGRGRVHRGVIEWFAVKERSHA